MKKMKGIRTIAALLLAFVMIFGSALAGDENSTKPNVDGVFIDANPAGDKLDLDFGDVVSDGITIQTNAGEIDIDADTVTGKEEDGITIQTNEGEIDIDADTVTGKDGDGILIGSIDGSNATYGVINLDVGDVKAEYITYSGSLRSGIDVCENDGTVNINQKTKPDANDNNLQTATTISGDDYGIYIKKNAGTITSNQGENATPGNVKGITSGIEIEGNAAGGTINLNHENVKGMYGIQISGNSGEIDIDANTVTDSYKGISIEGGSASGTINLNVGDVGDITEDEYGSITMNDYGVYIHDNAGTVNINQKMKTDPDTNETTGTSIIGYKGIEIRDNTGNINLNQGEDATPGDTSNIYVENNQGSINLTVGNAGGINLYNRNSSQDDSSFVVNAESVDGFGVHVSNIKDSDAVSITVNGKVESTDYVGISIDGSNTAVRAGEVSVTSDDPSIKVFGLEVSGGTVVVAENEENTDAKGNVTAKKETIGNTEAAGLRLFGDQKSDVVM